MGAAAIDLMRAACRHSCDTAEESNYIKALRLGGGYKVRHTKLTQGIQARSAPGRRDAARSISVHPTLSPPRRKSGSCYVTRRCYLTGMQAAKCRVCGVSEWNHVCAGSGLVPVTRAAASAVVNRGSAGGGDVDRAGAGHVGGMVADGPLIAPAGECEYCDRRRAYAAAAMRRNRKKAKRP
jgi:hypothetical protein